MVGARPLALSFVIPLYNSAATIAAVVHDIETLEVEGGHESDSRQRRQRRRDDRRLPAISCAPRASPSPWSSTRATSASTTPCSPAGATPAAPTSSISTTMGRIRRAKRCGCGSMRRGDGLDVVFGHYEVKQHSFWRNLGSWFTNRMTDWALDKPHGFYLSSFRCVSAFVAGQVDRLRRSVSVHRRAAAAGDPAHRLDQGAPRGAPRGPERLHAAPAASALAERVAELLAAAAAGRDRWSEW